MTCAIDHVVIGVVDPVLSAGGLRRRWGLGAVAGGTHPSGTGNWLIPLEPPAYLELLYVADQEAVAAGPAAGLLALDLSSEPLLGWAVRTDDIESVARRVGIEPVSGSVVDPDGRTAQWSVVAHPSPGVSSLPFFIQYDDPTSSRPTAWTERYVAADHGVRVGGFSWIEVGGDEGELRDWLADDSLPVRCAGGLTGVRAVAIASADGAIVIRPNTAPSAG